MGQLDEGGILTLQELMITALATANAVAKLLIDKGLITRREFDLHFSLNARAAQRSCKIREKLTPSRTTESLDNDLERRLKSSLSLEFSDDLTLSHLFATRPRKSTNSQAKCGRTK